MVGFPLHHAGSQSEGERIAGTERSPCDIDIGWKTHVELVEYVPEVGQGRPAAVRVGERWRSHAFPLPNQHAKQFSSSRTISLPRIARICAAV